MQSYHQHSKSESSPSQMWYPTRSHSSGSLQLRKDSGEITGYNPHIKNFFCLSLLLTTSFFSPLVSDCEVFPKTHPAPFSKVLTFFRKEPFALEAYYNNAKELPSTCSSLGTADFLGTLSLTNTQHKFKSKQHCLPTRPLFYVFIIFVLHYLLFLSVPTILSLVFQVCNIF